jgi:hypothetical protein
VPIIYDGRESTIVPVRSNFFDSFLMQIPRLFFGRYIHKTTQQPGLTLVRTLLNSLSTMRLGMITGMVRRLRSPSAMLRHKMIVYDDGPSVGEDGTMTRCEFCPTAIVRDGEVFACCEADYGLLNERSS